MPCRWRCGGATGTGSQPGPGSGAPLRRWVAVHQLHLHHHLIEAGIDASIGTVGDAYDNALMESTIGLYKTELIENLPPELRRVTPRHNFLPELLDE
jgi:transposase InsO family protein